jgi:hypothetical protein
MAQLELITGGYRVVAENTTERALLDHGRASGGELMLEEGCYRVRGAALLLPVEISYPTAERLCRAFESAARAHQQAAARRRDFKVVE